MVAHRADPRPDKIDLGVGVFKDEAGNTPVFRAVKAAERLLLEGQQTKAYLGAEGDMRFTALLQDLLFGADFDVARVAGLQTPGGTGALRLTADLLAHEADTASPGMPVVVGLPTWTNHLPILHAARHIVQGFGYFDIASQTIDFDAMLAACAPMRLGQPILLQASAHNPTGADLSPRQWDELIRVMAETRCLPIFDFAYHGLVADLESDAYPIRRAAEILPEFVVTYSCDKNFGLYRERTGALFVVCDGGEARARVMSNILALARANWSMPPDHGAAVVRTVLDDAGLTQSWRAELGEIAARIGAMRELLADGHPQLAFLRQQNGMFVSLGLSADQIGKLRDRHGIYLIQSGRMNITGMRSSDCPRVIDGLIDVGFLAA